MVKKCFILYLIFAFVPFCNYGQTALNKKIDTSFTINSTAKKVLKEYPNAVPVETKVPANVSAEYDVVYSSINDRKLHLDLFTPSKRNLIPSTAVIIIHGGGWKSGIKTLDHPLAINLASNGFVAAAIEYQLSTEALYPAAVLNIKSAILWLKKNAVKLNVNPTKIVLMGSSAGGHLASLAGVTAGIEKFENPSLGKNTQVAAIINIDGVMDMTTPEESGKDTMPSKPSAAKQWLGENYIDNPQLWIDASPLSYINRTTPTILFINSSIPRFHAGREKAIELMNKFNIYSEVHTLPGTPHPFWLFHPWFDETLNYILNFLRKL